ncbi:MAG: mechanosensitive ion channel family protein, partial [Christensenellales bacterium]
SGLALGLALQDALANLASGVILLFTKPFKENDFLRIGSIDGTVKKIKLTTTELISTDNVLISMPNNKVLTSEIYNYSAKNTRRLDLIVGVAYESDIDKVKETLYSIVNADERIFKNPEPAVCVVQLDSSSVNYRVRVWTSNANYWNVYNDFFEKILREFEKADIEIPYNKITVYSKEAQ